MSDILTPTLMILGDKDNIIDQNTAKQAFEKINTSDKKLVTLKDAHHHIMWLDGEYQRAENEIYTWIKERVK